MKLSCKRIVASSELPPARLAAALRSWRWSASASPLSTAILLLMLAALAGSPTIAHAQSESETPALRALLIAGGCCHDYPAQVQIISRGISQRANVHWTVFLTGDDRDEQASIYRAEDWARDYDVVVHNECFGGVTDVAFVDRIVGPHRDQGVPAVVIHCSMHSYRNAETDEWRMLLGVTSRRHEQGGRQLDVLRVADDHPIMQGFPDRWRTPNGELYVIEKQWPACQVLATAFGVDTQTDHPVIWTNTYGKARLFGTTLGHHNQTMLSTEWLDVVARGLLWATGHLQEDGTPADGYTGTGRGPLTLQSAVPAASPEPTPAN